jgi:tetratricopeptide (TPR) repeat protein
MKKHHHLCGSRCLGLSLILLATGVPLFADDTNQTPPPQPAATTSLAQQAQDTLQQASTPKDFADAAGLFNRALAADPNNDDLRQTLGWLYLDKLHQPQAAYKQLRIVVAHRPNDVNVQKLMGMACTQTGRPGEAVVHFKKASQLQPDDLWIRANYGRALARFGAWTAADQIYDEVLKKDPNNADARLGKAEIAAWRGQSDKALDILHKLLEENPNNVEALVLVADIHRWQWKLSESQQDYQRALNIDTNNQAALNGIKEAKNMGYNEIGGNVYGFKDSTHFLRESVGADARVYLADPLYLIGGASGWRFDAPGVGNIYRLDGRVGAEYHWARWLETSLQGDYFEYNHGNAFFGGEFSSRLTPMTGVDIYTYINGNQPFISSIASVTNRMKQHSVGNGLDIKLFGPFSFQNSFEAAKLSDNNLWIEEKPQLSMKVLNVPETYLRVQYDYLNYNRTNASYWTPKDYQVIWPVLDTSIPLCHCVSIDCDARAPYVVQENRFGYQVEAGPAIDLWGRVRLKASYYRSNIPGDIGTWSGQGGQASLSMRF